jgi:hypothetical protein
LSNKESWDVRGYGLDADGNVLTHADGSEYQAVELDNFFAFNARSTPMQTAVLKFKVPEVSTKWKIEFVNVAGRVCEPSPTEGLLADLSVVSENFTLQDTDASTEESTAVMVQGNCKLDYKVSGTAINVTESVTLLVNRTKELTIDPADGESVPFEFIVNELPSKAPGLQTKTWKESSGKKKW